MVTDKSVFIDRSNFGASDMYIVWGTTVKVPQMYQGGINRYNAAAMHKAGFL